MASKGLIVFALLLAAAFLVSTAEQTQAKKEETKAGVQGYGGSGGYHGGGGGDYHGGGGGVHGCRHQCCGHHGCHCCGPDEIPEVRN